MITEQQFVEEMAEFTAKESREIEMSNSPDEIGMDSIGVFEFLMKLEGILDVEGLNITDAVSSVEDLYDEVRRQVEDTGR